MREAPEPQIPFDYAQGRLSTAFGAKNAPNFAQDDKLFLIRTLAAAR
jgi:hypothetical protein